MTRGTGTYFSGTITGTNNIADLQTQLETRIKSYQSNGVDAWEEFDVIDAAEATRNVVFRSKGDRALISGAGDARLFVESDRSTTTLEFRIHQDWTTNGAGSGSNTVGQGGTDYRWQTLSDVTNIDYFGIINEYEFVFIFVQGGVYYWVHFGSPRRTHIPTNGNGVAFTDASSAAPVTDTVTSITDAAGTTTLVAAGTPFSTTLNAEAGRFIRITVATNSENNGDFEILTSQTDGKTITYANAAGITEGAVASLELDVTHSLDRDVSATPANGKISVGQKIWLYEISDTAALKTPGNIICDVVAVSATPDVTTLGSAGAFTSGAIVGLDPSPMFILAGQGANDHESTHFTNFNDASYSSTIGQVYIIQPLLALLTEGNLDPGSEGLYYGSQCLIESTDASKGGTRGSPEFVTFWAIGTQADQDRMQVNYLTTDAASYKVFPSINNNVGGINLAMGIGPGATV